MAGSRLAVLLFVGVTLTHCGIVDFGNMIHQVVQRSPFAYILYGCHCGPGGRGMPKDEIDWCCHVHDCCFGVMDTLGCRPMTKRYYFSYENGDLSCDLPVNDECARQVCECDRVAALCFKQHNNKFSKRTSMSMRMFCWGRVPDC
ncbi:basic phospholipase A2 caudoxin-like [Discoglossus pictus]